MRPIQAIQFGNAAVAASATAACLFMALARMVAADDDVVNSRRVSVVATAYLRAGGSEFLGGLSDLITVGRYPRLRFWAITDRGPKVNLQTPDGKVGALLQPDFRPAVFEIALSGRVLEDGSDARGTTVNPLQRVMFRGHSGKPVTGRPNGCQGDERLMDPSGKTMVAPDPNGIDSEGLARLSDGSLWLSEEYRPSLVNVSADGTLLRRYVPQGIDLPDADCDVHDTLPARYRSRKPNRGFEALAISPDETTLWALLQSPLEFPQPKAAKSTGNVRMLAFDLQARRPIAEFIYRLGDPADPAFANQGAPPDDGKLCAMAAIDNGAVLVLEQADDGTARLYRCSFAGATNTLEDGRPLESLGNLTEAGIAPLRKSLVADLASLMPRFAADITGGAWQAKPGERVKGLKLEGLAIVDPQRVALVNDNDFNADHIEDASKPERQSCLWIISLPYPLTPPEDEP